MRLKIFFSLFALSWLLLLVRIYYISIQSNAYYDEMAKRNALKVDQIAPLRGTIMDSTNQPLAVNKLGFYIAIAPHLRGKASKKLDEELDFIKSILPKQNIEKLKATYKKYDSYYKQDYVKIIDFISYDEIIAHYSKINLRQNIQIMPSSKRHYPFGSLASHIIGYVGKADQNDIKNNPISSLTGYSGKTGLESFYNKILQGKAGEEKTKVTAFNQEIEQISKTQPSSNDIKISIDLKLQKYITKIFGNDAGAVIVMDIKDGKILAAGSYPEYDLNQFVTGISQDEWVKLINNLDHPFTNKITHGLYPPGSVVKMAVALSFLSSKKITQNTTFFCSGVMKLGNRNFRCWKRWGHGQTNMNKAIRESCDDYFYKGSLLVGIDYIAPSLTKLGFGDKTNIDLPNEFIGTVPSREWKLKKQNIPWYQGDTVNTSIGQGSFLVTPIQIAKNTAIIATGEDIIPHFLTHIDGKKIKFNPKKNILSEFEIRQLPSIRKAMYEAANHKKGTANKRLENSLVTLAAKTGTAQVVGISQTEKKRMLEEDMEYFQRSHAWLTSYGPYKDPKYVVTVLVEHGGHGGLAAGPIVTQIYNKLIELGYLKADKTK